MNDQQSISPRRRHQELLAIPERQRTDAEWDELNELEIVLAAVNRVENHDSGARRKAPASATEQPKSVDGAQSKRPPKKFHKRPPKGNAPQGQTS